MTSRIKTLLLLLMVNVLIVYLIWHSLNILQPEHEFSKPLNQFPSTLISKSKELYVEIWSKAAFGQFLWENIFNGGIDKTLGDSLYIEGSTHISNITFLFRSGPSLKIESLNQFSIENLILLLNWRTEDKINYSLSWLQEVDRKNELRNVGIIALGNEKCHNDWFLRFFQIIDKIRFLFIIYDWVLVDNKVIFQWPLGIATYRDFPPSKPGSLNIESVRPYLCNFIATVYPKSSRKEIQIFFKSHQNYTNRCLIKTRPKWTSSESDQSLDYYVNALQLSELTLSPIGMNHECYRILEAVEYGSIPVIEVNLSHVKSSSCDPNQVYRIFHEFNAPFLYVSNWTQELPTILNNQASKTEAQKVAERVQLIKWYHRFKIQIRNRLIHVIQNNFL